MKASVDSVRMAAANQSDAITTTSSMMFGRTCRNMMRGSEKPSARQASTKSRSFIASVEARATRMKAGTAVMAMARIRLNLA